MAVPVHPKAMKEGGRVFGEDGEEPRADDSACLTVFKIITEMEILPYPVPFSRMLLGRFLTLACIHLKQALKSWAVTQRIPHGVDF